ncbi:MAG: hypothetical protein H7331_09960 [Bacteroidia bacterium]|nr:hypothetical protein [Bacteroidia bacterium]
MERQLIKYSYYDRETYSFLNFNNIKDYDELDELFFELLAIKNDHGC